MLHIEVRGVRHDTHSGRVAGVEDVSLDVDRSEFPVHCRPIGWRRRTASCRWPTFTLEGARIVDLLLSNGPDAIAETKACALRSAWSDLPEKDFVSLVESHSAKRQSPEAKEGLASFAGKRAATKG